MEAANRRLVVTQVDSHYNRITITREEIRLKISAANDSDLTSRLLKACFYLLEESTLQTFRGQLDCLHDNATTIQMYTCNGGKAFKLNI